MLLLLGAAVIGNPWLPRAVVDQWQWLPLPGAEVECKMVGEMLGCRPVLNTQVSLHFKINN